MLKYSEVQVAVLLMRYIREQTEQGSLQPARTKTWKAMCSKDKATTKDVASKRDRSLPYILGGHCTASHKYCTKAYTYRCKNEKYYRRGSRWFLIVRANSMSPVEGEWLTLAKLG